MEVWNIFDFLKELTGVQYNHRVNHHSSNYCNCPIISSRRYHVHQTTNKRWCLRILMKHFSITILSTTDLWRNLSREFVQVLVLAFIKVFMLHKIISLDFAIKYTLFFIHSWLILNPNLYLLVHHRCCHLHHSVRCLNRATIILDK